MHRDRPAQREKSGVGRLIFGVTVRLYLVTNEIQQRE